MTDSPFGSYLRAARARAGQSQRAFAARLGVSQALLSHWENGAATPRPQRLPALARALGVARASLSSVYEASRAAAGPPPEPRRALGVEELHAQARAHVLAHGPEKLEIWVLGATNLSVMRRAELLEKRWKENLLWGVDYTIVWALDLVDEDRFGTALSTLAALARKAAEEFPDQRRRARADPASPAFLRKAGGRDRPGRIRHLAVSILESPRGAMIDAYTRLAAGASDGAVAAPYTPGHDGSDAAVSRAARALMRVWHPESGVVAYRPLDATTPAAANVRLMPVTERIVARIAPELEESNYWFWLTPAGARRVVNAVVDLEDAVLAGKDRSGARPRPPRSGAFARPSVAPVAAGVDSAARRAAEFARDSKRDPEIGKRPSKRPREGEK